MKTTRHNKILELINKFQITTQEELIEHLLIFKITYQLGAGF